MEEEDFTGIVHGLFLEKSLGKGGGGGMEKIKKRIELREIIGLKEMTGVKERIRLKG